MAAAPGAAPRRSRGARGAHRRSTARRGDQRALEELLERRIAVAERRRCRRRSRSSSRSSQRGARRTRDARARLGRCSRRSTSKELRERPRARGAALAVELADLDGDARGAIMLLERLYFVGSEDERPALALAVAERWGALSPNGSATLLAWERLRRLAPEDPTALEELSARYAAARAGRRAAGRRSRAPRARRGEPAIARASSSSARATRALIEEQLGDARAAFAQLERVLGTPQRTAARARARRLRALAERGGLYGELARVLADEPDLASRMERALLFEERLREPRRAFEVLRAALAPDVLPRPRRRRARYRATLVPHLQRLGERVGASTTPCSTRSAICCRICRDRAGGALLTRAEVREKRMKDQSGALDELVARGRVRRRRRAHGSRRSTTDLSASPRRRDASRISWGCASTAPRGPPTGASAVGCCSRTRPGCSRESCVRPAARSECVSRCWCSCPHPLDPPPERCATSCGASRRPADRERRTPSSRRAHDAGAAVVRRRCRP